MIPSDSGSNNDPPIDGRCERCQAPIQLTPGYPSVCNDCYPLYGSCCQEWGEEQESESQPDKS